MRIILSEEGGGRLSQSAVMKVGSRRLHARRPAFAAAAIAILTPVRAEAPMPATPPVIVKPLISADRNAAGQPIVFPARNGHVTAALYEIAPGAVLPIHKHPFPRLGYVLSGTLRVTETDSGRTTLYRTGKVVLESVGVWHKGENAGPVRLRLLVIDLSEKGEATTISKTPNAP